MSRLPTKFRRSNFSGAKSFSSRITISISKSLTRAICRWRSSFFASEQPTNNIQRARRDEFYVHFCWKLRRPQSRSLARVVVSLDRLHRFLCFRFRGAVVSGDLAAIAGLFFWLGCLL